MYQAQQFPPQSPQQFPQPILHNNEIHLWLTSPESIQDPALLTQYHQLLSPDENARLKRFRFAKHRHAHLVTRALVRSVLSFYAPLSPHDWRFIQNAYGRPEIDPRLKAQLDIPHLRFNLSHTEGMIICAVVLQRDIGVDVENSTRLSADADIAKRFFSADEAACLQSLPEAQRRERFFTYWTLKEAYIKARGMGLSIPLDQFSFDVNAVSSQQGEAIGIRFAEHFEDQSQHWQFWSWQKHAYHFAVALKSQAPQELRLHQCIPLQSKSIQSLDLPS